MKTIARWLIECKQLYPEYLREEESRREERKKKDKKKKQIFTSISLAVLGIVAAVLGINKIGKK